MSRYVRARLGEEIFWGEIDGEQVVKLKNAPWVGKNQSGEKIPISECRLLAPATPSKIVLIGLNYHDHIKESQSANEVPANPIIFMKPPTAIIGPNDDIPYPPELDRVDYEGELAAVIGSRTYRVDEKQAEDAVFGYTCLNDVTARNVQKKDVQWTRGKSYDGFSPLGPWIATDVDPLDLKIETYVNDQLRQDARTSQQIWNIFRLISFISGVMTLMPGDVVSTGTPKGIGPLKPGDRVKVMIEKIGTLENGVVKL